MVRFKTLQVLQLAPLCLAVKWELENVPAGYTEVLKIHRAESPEGPWELIAENISNREYYLDWDANVHNPLVTVYYKVTGIITDGGSPPDEEDIKDSSVEHLRMPQDAATLEIVRRFNLVLEQPYIGTPGYFLIKRTWGARCECYDTTLGKNMGSDCPRCFNTGLFGGYYTPIMGYVAEERNTKTLARHGFINIAVDEQVLWTTNYPRLKVGDIHVDANNNRWALTKLARLNMRLHSVVKQIFVAKEIPHEDVIYKIHVDDVFRLEPVRDYFIWRSIPTLTS